MPAALRVVLAGALVAGGLACGDAPSSPTSSAGLALADSARYDAVAGEAFAEPLRVRLTGADGRPAVGVLVEFATIGAVGMLERTSARTDGEGVALSGRWQAGTRAGIDSVRVTSDGLPPLVVRGTVRAGAPVSMVQVAGGAGIVDLDRPVDSLPAWKLADRYGNPAVGAAVLLRSLWPGRSDLSPPRALADSAGVARVARWIPRTARVQELVATVESDARLADTVARRIRPGTCGPLERLEVEVEGTFPLPMRYDQGELLGAAGAGAPCGDSLQALRLTVIDARRVGFSFRSGTDTTLVGARIAPADTAHAPGARPSITPVMGQGAALLPRGQYDVIVSRRARGTTAVFWQVHVESDGPDNGRNCDFAFLARGFVVERDLHSAQWLPCEVQHPTVPDSVLFAHRFGWHGAGPLGRNVDVTVVSTFWAPRVVVRGWRNGVAGAVLANVAAATQGTLRVQLLLPAEYDAAVIEVLSPTRAGVDRFLYTVRVP